MSTGVIFILGKGVIPILASGVKSTWPQGSSAPGFSIITRYLKIAAPEMLRVTTPCICGRMLWR